MIEPESPDDNRAAKLFLGDLVELMPRGVRRGKIVMLDPDEFGVIAVDSAPEPNLPEGE